MPGLRLNEKELKLNMGNGGFINGHTDSTSFGIVGLTLSWGETYHIQFHLSDRYNRCIHHIGSPCLYILRLCT